MNLNLCLARATDLSDADNNLLKKLTADYQGDGMMSPEAASRALEEVMRLAYADRNGVISDISVKGGVIPPGSPVMFSPAWHGTPNTEQFDRFDNSYMSTGEGYQMMGWGHYFAQDKSVAGYYRDLDGDRWTINGESLTPSPHIYNIFQVMEDGAMGNEWAAAAYLTGIVKGARVTEATRKKATRLLNEFIAEKTDETVPHPSVPKSAMKVIIRRAESDVRKAEALKASIGGIDVKTLKRRRGLMYRVELLPKEDEYLDLDKSISDQSSHVQNVIKETGIDVPDPGNTSGRDFYQMVEKREGSDKQASLYLDSIGIPGNRYLDAVSRSRGGGTSNYVIFSDDNVEIVDSGPDLSPRRTNGQEDRRPRSRDNGSSLADGVRRDEATGIPLNDAGQVPLTHWGATKGLTQLDPAYWGTAAAGREKRLAGDPNFRNRTYFGLPGYVVESNVNTVAHARYFATLQPGDLYRWEDDPDGIRARIKSDNPDLPASLRATLSEAAIVDAGYKGYWGAHPSGPIVALFEPVEVQQADKFLGANLEPGTPLTVAGVDADGNLPGVKLSPRKPNAQAQQTSQPEVKDGEVQWPSADDHPILSVRHELPKEPPSDTRNEMTLKDNLLSKFVDRYRAMENVQKDIGELPETEDTMLAVTTYPGVTRAMVDEFEEQDIQPLLAAVENAGISFKDLGEFLTARHVLLDNVNATLRDRNPDIEDNEALSGMTDKKAQEIVDRHAGDSDLQTIAGFIDSINHRRVDHLVEGDLMTKDEADSWRSLYEHYVPLNRADMGNDMPARGKGFDARSKPSKLRAGSRKEVDYENVVARILSQYETTLVRVEKNKVGQTLYRMIEDNPNPELWTLAKTVTKRIRKKDGTYRLRSKIEGDIATRPQLKADGTISRVPDLNASNLMVVRFKGVKHYITFNTQNKHAAKIATVMMNQDASKQGSFVKVLHGLNRFLSTINTSLSPEFVISNFFRDIQTAGYNLTDTEIKDLEAKVLKQTPRALVGIRSFLRGDKSHELAPWFDRFRKAGGQTGWIQSYEDIGDRTKAMERELGLWRKPGLKQVTGLLKVIEDYNNVVENAVRLSTFKAAVESGLTDKKAARIAKQVTVDFNRRGEYGVMMNAMFLFYNAGVQGSARLLRATLNPKNHRLHKMLAATVVAAAALDMLNRAIGGDDDDGEPKYDKIREMYGERNLIIMTPWADDGYIKIPLPWGYNIFHVFGQEMGAAIDAARGDKFEWDPMHSAVRMMSAAGNAFNPMQDGSLLQTISPTISDPLVRIAENKDWHGGPLYPNYDKSAPNYTKFYSSVRDTSKDVAKWMYDAGLDKETRTSWLDVSPEWIDMGWDFFTGAAGRVVADTAGFSRSVIDGEPMEWRDIPMARKMIGEVGDSQRKRQFYDKMYEVIDVDKSLRRIKKDPEKDRAYYMDAKEGVGDRIKLIPAAKQVKRQLSRMKKQLVKAKRAGDSERVKQVEQNMMKVMMRYTTRYNRTMYGYSAT